MGSKAKSDPRYKGMVSATRPRGRNKPLGRKLENKPSYSGSYARKGHRSGKRPTLDVGAPYMAPHNGHTLINPHPKLEVHYTKETDPILLAWEENGANDRALGLRDMMVTNPTQWRSLGRDIRQAYMRGYMGN